MANDTHERCAGGVAATITAIGLTHHGRTLPVYQKMMPDDSFTQYPLLLVTYEGEAEQIEVASFENNFDVIYPVRVWIANRQAAQDQTMRSTYLSWRKQIADALRVKTTLSDSGGSIPGVYDVQVRGTVVFDPKLPEYQMMVSGFLVQVYTRDSN